MKFLLDTNTCIVYMKGKNLSLKRRLESTLIQDIFVCSVVKAES
jgi:tRNA(fMet)-specific endonuclease VapC